MSFDEKNEIIANTVGGAAQAIIVTIVGYPFDLVKARLQTKMYANAVSCVKGTIKNEGLMGFYRGAAMPMLSHMLKRPIQYPLTEYLKVRISTRGNFDGLTETRSHPIYNYIIGGLTGIIGPIFGTPLQVVKVSMQTSTDKIDRSNKNSWYYIKHNYKTNGLKGFYRGFIPTAIKDCTFATSFVGTYYTLRDVIGKDTIYKNFFNGAAAHCATWAIFIPIDYIKTTIQRSEKPLKIKDVVINSYRQNGITVFWKGVIPACLRTIPVSGIAMVGYEHIRTMILDINNKKM
jgi:solute carrier family 25 carnitine/acylcarnitine transporter 20/29